MKVRNKQTNESIGNKQTNKKSTHYSWPGRPVREHYPIHITNCDATSCGG